MRAPLAVIALFLLASFARAGLCDSYKIAAADTLRLTDTEKFYCMYFWFGDIPEADRPMYLLAFAGHLHQISTEPSLAAFPQVVTQDYSVVRVLFIDYGWSLDFVNRITKADPYREFWVKVENLNFYWPGGAWYDGKHYAKNAFVVSEKTVPVVSASWFMWQTIAQDERDPGYLDALGLKTRDDMDALSGFSAEVNKKARRYDFIDVPEFSGISRKYLRNVFFQGVSGRTRAGTDDFKKATRFANPLQVRTEFSDKAPASEWIFPLPNDFPGYFLDDGKNAQATAPDFVGFDRSTPSTSNDGKIHVGVSCLRCHFREGVWGKGSSAIIDFVPHFRSSAARGFNQGSPDYERKLQFEREYLRHFGDEVVIMRLRYQVAIITATGLAADEWAMRLTTWYEKYDYGATVEEAEAFLGCGPNDLIATTPNGQRVPGKLLRDTMATFAEKVGVLDNTLSLFAQGLRIPRDNFHEIYPTLRATWEGMRNAKPFDPKEHFVPGGTAGDKYSIKQWLLQRRLPDGSVLPKLPKLSTSLLLPAELQLQLLQSVRLPGGHSGVQHQLSGADRRDLRGRELQPADRLLGIDGAIHALDGRAEPGVGAGPADRGPEGGAHAAGDGAAGRRHDGDGYHAQPGQRQWLCAAEGEEHRAAARFDLAA
jgi:hypothetical protein